MGVCCDSGQMLYRMNFLCILHARIFEPKDCLQQHCSNTVATTNGVFWISSDSDMYYELIHMQTPVQIQIVE